LYFALGKKEEGFAALNRHVETDPYYTQFVIDPLFDGVREDPRFKAILARIKLPGASSRQ
jgi:hypothetical protein